LVESETGELSLLFWETDPVGVSKPELANVT